MKKLRLYILLALLILFGAKALGQEPEWEWSSSLTEADTAFFRADEPYELADGTVLLTGRTVYKDDCGFYKYYFPHPALLSLSSEGIELYHRQYAKEGYFGTMPHVLESGSGEVFLVITYSPDHDTCSSNYFKNFEPVTDHCILGLYKLNDDLSIAESHELEIPIDTFEWRNEQNQLMYYRCGQIYPISAFIDSDGNVVGAYSKTVSWDNDNPRGHDSTVFFRMDLQGNMVRIAVSDIGLASYDDLGTDLVSDIIIGSDLRPYYMDVRVELVELLDVLIENGVQVGAHGMIESDCYIASVISAFRNLECCGGRRGAFVVTTGENHHQRSDEKHCN